MAKLTAAKRNALPDSAFAIPSKRKYPINDASHAARAKGRAAQMAHQGGKGHISKGTEQAIDRKANKVLKHHKGGRAHAGGHHPKEHHGAHENAHILPMAGSKAAQHSHPGHNPGMGHNPGLVGHPSHDGHKGYGDGFGHGGMHSGKSTHHNIRHPDHHKKMREG